MKIYFHVSRYNDLLYIYIYICVCVCVSVCVYVCVVCVFLLTLKGGEAVSGVPSYAGI